METVFESVHLFITRHGLFCWSLYYLWNVYVGSLLAPTKESSQAYRSWFKVTNATAGNWFRATPKVEESPNFVDAVKKLNGGLDESFQKH